MRHFTRPSPPRDPAAREHVARLDRYRTPPADENDRFFVGILHDGAVVAGRENGTPSELGQAYKFRGRWVDHDKFGWQFNFATFAMQEPSGRNGILKYLTKHCEGIGEKRAADLYDAYGADAVATLRTNPGKVASDGIVPLNVAQESAKALWKISESEETKLELFDLFAGRGFWADTLIIECIKKWGKKAPERIRRDPFAMMVAEMTSCGFKRCDKLYCELGLPRLALKRQVLAGWNELHSDSTGNTWIPIEQAVRAIKSAIGDGCSPEKAVRLGIRTRWFRHCRDSARKLWLAEGRRAINEQTIATRIKRMSQNESVDWPKGIIETLSDHQQEQLDIVRQGRIGILAGTPGTGKTYTAAALIRKIVNKHGQDKVAIAAPTGKAAVRCSQAMKANNLSITAITLHRLLGIVKSGDPIKPSSAAVPGFREHGPNNPLPYRFVIVDEVSMLDTDLAAKLLGACDDDTHLLMIGDPYQLPPVGHGAPLRDMIAAGVPCGELTEIRRNAGLIVKACRAIKNGESFDFAEKYDAATGQNLRMLDVDSTAETIDRLTTLMQHFQRTKKIDPIKDVQIVVGRNDKSELSRHPLNEMLQNILNQDGKRANKNPFRVGDKIICLKNGEHSGLYLANGEMGFVRAVDEKLTIAEFAGGMAHIKMKKDPNRGRGDEEPTKADEENGSSKGRAGTFFDLAYAVTCHKMQGSEANCVIVIADEAAGRVASREWWYTAISRASDLCVVIGKRTTMENQARRMSLNKRKTFLTELLREGLAACQTVTA